MPAEQGEERLALGRIGLWTMQFEAQPMARVREAAAEIERLGYGALWCGEYLGRDGLIQASQLLAATRHMVVATGITSIFARDAVTMAREQQTLAEAFPGRFLLGLGGHRARPVTPAGEGPGPHAILSAYLDAMDAAPFQAAPPVAKPRRMIAALGPKMLRLATARAWGAHSYLVPVAHTARAREIMGPDAFLAVEQGVILEVDPARAQEIVRDQLAIYLQAPHQTNNLRSLGFAEDVAAGGSERLAEALFVWGGAEAIKRRVREHLDAGADHVCVQVLTAEPSRLPIQEWRDLANILL